MNTPIKDNDALHILYQQDIIKRDIEIAFHSFHDNPFKDNKTTPLLEFIFCLLIDAYAAYPHHTTKYKGSQIGSCNPMQPCQMANTQPF